MKLVFLFVIAVPVVGCTDPCPQVVAQVDPAVAHLYQRPGGLSIGAYVTSTPAPAAGLVVSNSCDPLGSASQFDTTACAPADGDSLCALCLKAKCCTETLEWVGGVPDAGAGFASCAESYCDSSCTRPQ